MKKVILSVLLAGASLMAIDGAALYKQKCVACHGSTAQRGPMNIVAPIAGMDISILARKIRSYRDQEERHDPDGKYKDNQMMKDSTSSLSNQQIGAIATYINGLK
ncbi:cytochrome c [Sulfurimonas sp.]|uniref:c-type cytochrome n=1 Tax=Sulfurimonas sp. TaxID=2022749 RepID=UPI003561A749